MLSFFSSIESLFYVQEGGKNKAVDLADQSDQEQS